jgi:hypothetical protein
VKKKTGRFVVEWEHDGESSSTRVVEGWDDLPRQIKEMIVDTLLRDLASTGDLRIRVG